MKKQLLVIIVIAAFMYGCGETGNKQDAKEASVSKEDVELSNEIETIDSVSIEMDKAKKDIEESSDKLDELLNDLGQ